MSFQQHTDLNRVMTNEQPLTKLTQAEAVTAVPRCRLVTRMVSCCAFSEMSKREEQVFELPEARIPHSSV